MGSLNAYKKAGAGVDGFTERLRFSNESIQLLINMIYFIDVIIVAIVTVYGIIYGITAIKIIFNFSNSKAISIYLIVIIPLVFISNSISRLSNDEMKIYKMKQSVLKNKLKLNN